MPHVDAPPAAFGIMTARPLAGNAVLEKDLGNCANYVLYGNPDFLLVPGSVP
jgi:hypothetical protein